VTHRYVCVSVCVCSMYVGVSGKIIGVCVRASVCVCACVCVSSSDIGERVSVCSIMYLIL